MLAGPDECRAAGLEPVDWQLGWVSAGLPCPSPAPCPPAETPRPPAATSKPLQTEFAVLDMWSAARPPPFLN